MASVQLPRDPDSLPAGEHVPAGAERRPAAVLVVVTATAAYVIAAWAALGLSLPPAYAAPIYPSAGIAFVAALLYGRAGLFAAALGGFAVNFGLAAARGQLQWTALITALAVGLGAAMQAGGGSALVRRFVAQPLTLAQPRDVWRFLMLSAPVACTINPSIATAALAATGVIDRGDAAFTWWTWWVGDSLGVLIAAPALLTFLGRPREDWAPRRTTLALPLLGVTAMLVAASIAVSRWDEQRVRSAFEREAADAAGDVSTWLHEPLQALQAWHVMLLTREHPSREALRRASAGWLAQPRQMHAMGYGQRLARRDIAAYEAAQRAEGVMGYRVFDHTDAGPASPAGDEVVAVSAIEPLNGPSAATGINALSIPAAAEAIGRARRSGQPVASETFRLGQASDAESTEVAVYQALYRGDPESSEARDTAFRGVGFVTVRVDAALRQLMKDHADRLAWCLVDLDALASRARLAGAIGCDVAPRLALRLDQALMFAGRNWELRLDAQPRRIAESEHAGAWLFSVLGLAAATLLGALLLVITGRARRVQQAVDERTAALRREIGERERTAEALRASEQQLQAILDSAPLGIAKTDLAGRIVKANPAYCRMVGYTEDELRALTVGQLTHADDRAEDARMLAAMARGECDRYRREKRYLTRDGGVLHARLTVAVLRDAAGRPEFAVGVVEDVGEQVRLAEAERARERAEQADRAKTEFVSRMSHELRTPLNAMLGFAQLLGLDRKPALVEHQRAWAAQIQQAGWHLLHMINDTLDLSRIESGTLRLESKPLALSPLLADAVSMVHGAAEKRGLRIEQALDARCDAVLGDATRLKQILTNLLSNAVKYNVDGGRVGIRSRSGHAGYVELLVTDSGLGMTGEQLASLFQPYNRLGRERSGVEGSGIGLVISRKLAELMGGSLRAHSVAGQGSTFVLTLPRARGGAVDDATGSEPQLTQTGYRQRLVHYIEDNETNIEVMRGMLLRRPQVQLTVSTTGLDGLAAIRQRRPNLILLDMHLPDIDGLELLRHLKADDSLATIPVVVVSADATAAYLEAALTAGAAHYITKPVNLPDFLAVLDSLLEDTDTYYG